MGPSRILKVTYAHLPEIPSHTRTKYRPIIRNETETDAVTQVLFLYERPKWLDGPRVVDTQTSLDYESCIPERSHLFPPPATWITLGGELD